MAQRRSTHESVADESGAGALWHRAPSPSLKHVMSANSIRNNPFVVADREGQSDVAVDVAVVVRQTNPGLDDVRLHPHLRESLHVQDLRQAERIFDHIASGRPVEEIEAGRGLNAVVSVTTSSSTSPPRRPEKARAEMSQKHSLSLDVTTRAGLQDRRHTLGQDQQIAELTARLHSLSDDDLAIVSNTSNQHDLLQDALSKTGLSIRKHSIRSEALVRELDHAGVVPRSRRHSYAQHRRTSGQIMSDTGDEPVEAHSSRHLEQRSQTRQDSRDQAGRSALPQRTPLSWLQRPLRHVSRSERASSQDSRNHNFATEWRSQMRSPGEPRSPWEGPQAHMRADGGLRLDRRRSGLDTFEEPVITRDSRGRRVLSPERPLTGVSETTQTVQQLTARRGRMRLGDISSSIDEDLVPTPLRPQKGARRDSTRTRNADTSRQPREVHRTLSPRIALDDSRHGKHSQLERRDLSRRRSRALSPRAEDVMHGHGAATPPDHDCSWKSRYLDLTAEVRELEAELIRSRLASGLASPEAGGDAAELGIEGLTIVMHRRGLDDVVIDTDLRSEYGDDG